MNKRLARLQARKAAIAADMRKLLDTADNDGRELSAEEQATYTAHETEMGQLDAAIAREERLAEAEKSLATVSNTSATSETDELAAKPKAPRIDVRQPKPKHFESGEDAYKAGQFLRAVGWNDPKAALWCREHGVDLLASQSGMNTTANSAGGYLVPLELESAIIRLVDEYGVFRRNARVVPMASDSLMIPRRTGGLSAYWVNENSDATVSQITYDAVQLTAKKLQAVCRYSSEIGEDAVVSIADEIAREMAQAFAYSEDVAGFNGDGTSTYGGVYGATVKLAAGSTYTALTGNTAFSTLDLEDFEGIAGSLPLWARNGAAWFISPQGFAASMQRLAWAAGGNTTANIAGGTGMSFLGYPVVLSTVLNSTLTAQTSTIIALFGNMNMAVTLGTRRGITIKMAGERYIEFDQVGVFGTQRLDINVHEIGTASAAGPLLALKTPSS